MLKVSKMTPQWKNAKFCMVQCRNIIRVKNLGKLFPKSEKSLKTALAD